LAREAEADLDEVLVTLWDAGIDCVAKPSDLVPARLVAKARSALGLVGLREQLTVDYWLEVSGLGREALTDRLAEVGVKLEPNVRRIPKNSLRRIRQLFLTEQASRAGSLVQDRKDSNAALEPLIWRTIGRTPVRSYLSEDQIISIHAALEDDFRESGDPIEPPGVKDPALVSMSAQRPHTSLGSTLKYPTVEMAGAALYHSVALNHGFHNGNKRTALVCLIAFLDENGMVMKCDQDELFRMTLRVAQHGLVPAGSSELADREVLELAEWIRRRSRSIDHADRPMKWLKLKQLLRSFDCDFETAVGVGNRLNIYRTVERRGRLGRKRTERLQMQVAWAGDGTEAARNTVHEIRRRLELDDDHGVDSQVFYQGAEIDGFIIEYRRILQRLSNL
jgi:death-on-curing family protein